MYKEKQYTGVHYHPGFHVSTEMWRVSLTANIFIPVLRTKAVSENKYLKLTQYLKDDTCKYLFSSARSEILCSTVFFTLKICV